MIFDMKTLILIYFIINIINAVTMYIIWLQFRNRFDGLSFWLADMVLQAAGVGMILMRGIINDFMSIVVSNTLLLSGSIFILIGLERFVGKRGPQIQNYILIVLFFFVNTYISIIRPDITIREIIISAMIIIFTSQIFWLLAHKVPGDLRRITRITGVVIGGYAVSSLVRMILLIAFPLKTNNFFQSGFADSMAITVYLSLNICLIIALVLMVTKRLLGEVQAQEEKFTKAFHSSPYAIILTSHSDGKIFEVNNGFVKITGYRYDEVIGKTTLELRLLDEDSDRRGLVDQLYKNNKLEEVEIQVRKKSGEMMTGLMSADIIIINNQKYILSSISDITGRKQAEEKIRNLLHEKDLILKEVHHRIKNNMNTINALLFLQSEEQKNAICRDILVDAANRVQGMMVLYDKLYRSDNHQVMSIINFLPPLVHEITSLFPTSAYIKKDIRVEDFELNAGVLSSLGIIINELITNSIKYAFGDTGGGEIKLSAGKKGTEVTIIYSDNGTGLPGSVTFENSKGLGMQLISMLVQQIHGSIEIRRDAGTEFTIKFEA